MEAKGIYEEFMRWLKNSDYDFFEKYKDNYEKEEDKIIINDKGLTDEEWYFLDHKFKLFSLSEKAHTKS